MEINNDIIFFDGDCHLCNRTVQSIIRFDKKQHFRFASLQSDFCRSVLQQSGFEKASSDSFLLVQNGKIFSRSTAVLRVLKQLSFPVNLLFGFIIVPEKWRNRLYNYVARNRYTWFGKNDACSMQLPGSEKLFLP